MTINEEIEKEIIDKLLGVYIKVRLASGEERILCISDFDSHATGMLTHYTEDWLKKIILEIECYDYKLKFCDLGDKENGKEI